MSITDVIFKIYALCVAFSNSISKGGGIFAVLIGVWGFGKGLISELIVKMDALAVGATGNADFTPLGFVNYIFPLDTLLSHVAILSALVLASALVRIIKSFVPTIAS
jgi:hypothetical protein